MDYLKFNFDTKKLKLKESAIRLYPLVCMHVGASQCDMKFILEHIARLKKDPNGRGIYLGDAGECVTKLSKGGIYEQLLSPQSQQDVVADILDPVKDKMLLGIRGNHGNRIDKETGLGFDKTLCLRLGIPYMGTSCMVNLQVNRSSYDLFFHHGSDSGVALQSKVNKAVNFTRFINADALFTAHSHACIELPPDMMLSCDNVGKKIITKQRHQYICGCGYDSRTGYAEEKGYPPILPAYIVTEFSGKIINGYNEHKQESRIYRSDATHELTHEYVLQYI